MAGKRLVCEADVLAMAPGSELVIDAATLATPSALDAAHRRDIRVVRSCERSVAPAPPDAAALARLLGRDGTYVVVVRAGRAVVTRLGEHGPESP
jgi:hypothetical protein